MTNPFLRRNPFLSLWLTGANRAMMHAQGTMRHVAAAHQHAVMREATRHMIDLWTAAWIPPAKPHARKSKRRAGGAR